MSDSEHKCRTCNGWGLVLVRPRAPGFGDGFAAFMRASIRYEHDVPPVYEWVCPACEGSGVQPGQENQGKE